MDEAMSQFPNRSISLFSALVVAARRKRKMMDPRESYKLVRASTGSLFSAGTAWAGLVVVLVAVAVVGSGHLKVVEKSFFHVTALSVLPTSSFTHRSAQQVTLRQSYWQSSVPRRRTTTTSSPTRLTRRTTTMQWQSDPYGAERKVHRKNPVPATPLENPSIPWRSDPYGAKRQVYHQEAYSSNSINGNRKKSDSAASNGADGSYGGGGSSWHTPPDPNNRRPATASEAHRRTSSSNHGGGKGGGGSNANAREDLYHQLFTCQLEQDSPDWEVVRDILLLHSSKDRDSNNNDPNSVVRMVDNVHQDNVLHFACGKKAPLWFIEFVHQLCPELIMQMDKRGRYPLHDACVYLQSKDVIEYMIRKFPRALLHQESSYEYLPIHCACEADQSLDVIQLLVETYPDSLSITNNSGETPLDVAALCGHSDIVDLLESYSSTSATNSDSSTKSNNSYPNQNDSNNDNELNGNANMNRSSGRRDDSESNGAASSSDEGEAEEDKDVQTLDFDIILQERMDALEARQLARVQQTEQTLEAKHTESEIAMRAMEVRHMELVRVMEAKHSETLRVIESRNAATNEALRMLQAKLKKTEADAAAAADAAATQAADSTAKTAVEIQRYEERIRAMEEKHNETMKVAALKTMVLEQKLADLESRHKETVASYETIRKRHSELEQMIRILETKHTETLKAMEAYILGKM